MERADLREYATDAIKFWEPWRRVFHGQHSNEVVGLLLADATQEDQAVAKSG